MNTTETSGQKISDVIASLQSIQLVAWRLKQWEKAVKRNNIKNLEAVNERSSQASSTLHSAPVRY